MPSNPKLKGNLKNVGLRVTSPRIKILTVLESGTLKHMSAEDIYDIMLQKKEDVSLATVYRVLTQFVMAGLAIKHHFSDGRAVFELDSGIHHDHLMCIKCAKVVEFIDDVIEKQQEEIALQFGFKLTSHSLQLYGVCNECNAKN